MSPTLTPRQREIFGWLNDAGYLSTEQLASRYGVSSQTIRRDINELSLQGLARRMHGGLSLPASQHNISYLQRSTAHVERKRRIAQAAPHPDRLHRLRDVMHPHDLRPAIDAGQRQRDRPAQSLVRRRLVRQRADDPLAAGPQRHRAA